MRTIDGPDELRSLVGQEIGVSDWFEVRQDRINLFTDATDDHQWIHVDPAKSAGGPFGTPIAHGYLTLSLLPPLKNNVFERSGRMADHDGAQGRRKPVCVAESITRLYF